MLRRRQSIKQMTALAAAPLLFKTNPLHAQGVGQKLVLFPAPLLSGGLLAPSDFDKKVTLLYSWASWCPFCLRDLPALREKFDEHKDKGFIVLGLNLDKDPDLALKWIATYKVNFPSIRLTAEYQQAYMPKRVVTPAWWLTNRDGMVIDSSAGNGAEFIYRNRTLQIDKAVNS